MPFVEDYTKLSTFFMPAYDTSFAGLLTSSTKLD